jgi:hypothetical protein
MAESEAFTTACEELEARSSLDKLEARGTIRLSLKSAGLDANTVNPDELVVVIDKVLPSELESRGVADIASVCGQIKSALSGVKKTADSSTPEAIFARLGG